MGGLRFCGVGAGAVRFTALKTTQDQEGFLGMNTNVNAVSDSHCSICLDSLDTTADHAATTLRCGHVFGRACIVEWATIKSSCPLCRSYVDYHQLQELQRSGMQLNRPLHERHIKLAVFSALMTMLCYPAHGFFATVKVAGSILAPICYIATTEVLVDWLRGEGNLRELLIERYTPVVDSLIGFATGFVVSAAATHLGIVPRDNFRIY